MTVAGIEPCQFLVWARNSVLSLPVCSRIFRAVSLLQRANRRALPASLQSQPEGLSSLESRARLHFQEFLSSLWGSCLARLRVACPFPSAARLTFLASPPNSHLCPSVSSFLFLSSYLRLCGEVGQFFQSQARSF